MAYHMIIIINNNILNKLMTLSLDTSVGLGGNSLMECDSRSTGTTALPRPAVIARNSSDDASESRLLPPSSERESRGSSTFSTLAMTRRPDAMVCCFKKYFHCSHSEHPISHLWRWSSSSPWQVRISRRTIMPWYQIRFHYSLYPLCIDRFNSQ